MAVYTEVTDEALEAFLAEYDLGSLVAYRGIAEGVENLVAKRLGLAAK